MESLDLSQVVEALPLPVVIADGDTSSATFNAAARDVLGAGPMDLADLSERFATFVSGTDDPFPLERWPLFRALRGQFSDVELELEMDGGRIPLRVWGAPMFDEDGRVTAGVVVFFDTTDRRRAERSEAEARRLAELNDMASAFVTSISHEIRTPLTSVVAITETLADRGGELDGATTGRWLERLKRSVGDLEARILDLIDVDRLLRGTLHPRRVAVDIAEIARRVALEMLDIDAPHLRLDLTPSPLQADPAYVERIIETLLANALKHNVPGTPVEIIVAPANGGAEIRVDDRGRGIPHHLRESIFAPFVRGPGHPEHAPGLAVGLTLVAKLAEIHGGRAWVEDGDGHGASFRVFLADAT